MNGCCMTNADSSSHDIRCPLYWPCGCRKSRLDNRNGLALTHTHTYTEPADPRGRRR